MTSKYQDLTLIPGNTLFDCPQIGNLKILRTTNNTLSVKTNCLQAFGNELLTAPVRWGYRAAGDEGFS
jgi:predicted RNA-binding Zn-ribbon protein involved in translation (DUF1610 family)